MTEKLYYTDSYLRTFSSEVVACNHEKKGYGIVLASTAFFPEGGGQYGDTGFLDGKEVTDTKEREGRIIHFMEEPLAVGSQVLGELNWEKRFECMQQHSAEHMISGIVGKRFGYHNVGFHLGRDVCTLDFDGPLSDSEIREVEMTANKAVWENIPVTVRYPDKDTLKNMDYRSKIEIRGQVRIIDIPGIDRCACCAPHVRATGEIGMMKIIHRMAYKGGCRLTMAAGGRAFMDYGQKDDSVKAISRLLCVKENEVDRGTQALKQEMEGLKEDNAVLRRKLLTYKAEETEVSDFLWIFDDELKGDDLRLYMNLLLNMGAGVCGIFAFQGGGSHRFVMGSRDHNVKVFLPALCAEGKGKGGGKPEMIQGSTYLSEEEIRRALQSVVGDMGQ